MFTRTKYFLTDCLKPFYDWDKDKILRTQNLLYCRILAIIIVKQKKIKGKIMLDLRLNIINKISLLQI